VPIIPLTAVFTFSGSQYVLDGSSPKPTPIKVTIGAIDDNFAEILSGLTPGAAVAVGSSERLRRAAFGRAAIDG
jgi:hypothetical protein